MIRNNIYILMKILQYSKMHVLISFVLRLLNILFNIWFSILFTIKITDYLLKGIEFVHIAKVVIATILLIVFQMVLGAVYNMYFGKIKEQLIVKELRLDLYEKIAFIDLKEYQNDTFYDRVTRALSEANERFTNGINDYADFICKIISILLVSIFLGTLDWSMCLYVIIPIVVNYLIDIKLKKVYFEKNQKTTNVKRRIKYCHRISYLPEYLKDNKLYGVYLFLSGKYNDFKEEELELETYYSKKIYMADFIQEIVNLICITILPAVIIMYKVQSGIIDISEIVAVLSSISLLYFNINSIISYLPKFIENSLFVENFKIFYEYKTGMSEGDLATPLQFETLKLDEVSFSYEEGNKVLNGISIDVKQGEKIAIVGANGSGKSTLLKLIMRLYDPDEGNILVNGQDIRNYKSQDYHGLYGVVFQDFNLYAFNLIENLCLNKGEKITVEEIKAVLAQVGLLNKISSHPLDILAEVGNEFSDGINFSGGEKQKMAIARALLHKGEIMIFDEASSALDPVAEYEINKLLFEVFEKKTMVIVSHRLSTVINSDKIYYLDKGVVKECGRHEELMELNGGYSYLFNLQASQYNS